MEPDSNRQDPEANQQETKLQRSSIELQRVETEPTNYSSEKYDVEKSEKARAASSLRPEIIPAPEGIGSWMTCLKYGLFITNFIIWLFGVAIVGVCVWMKADPDFWNFQLNLDMTQMSKAVYLGIAVGAIILVIGLVGCIGALYENICMLIVYIVVIVVIVILELAGMGVIWAATNKKEFGDSMKETIRKGIGNVNGDEQARYFIELLQSKLHCCGMTGVEDYTEGELTSGPLSKSCLDSSTGFPYTKGCVDTIVEYLKKKAALVGGILVAILLLQFGALVPAICLCCGLRQGK